MKLSELEREIKRMRKMHGATDDTEVRIGGYAGSSTVCESVYMDEDKLIVY